MKKSINEIEVNDFEIIPPDPNQLVFPFVAEVLDETKQRKCDCRMIYRNNTCFCPIEKS